jgi:hypothetical protein
MSITTITTTGFENQGFRELTANEMAGMQGGSPSRYVEIMDFSFGVENPTPIGSALGGAGTGK